MGRKIKILRCGQCNTEMNVISSDKGVRYECPECSYKTGSVRYCCDTGCGGCLGHVEV